MEEFSLPGGLRARSMDTKGFDALLEQHREKVLGDIMKFRAFDALAEHEKKALEPLFVSFGEQWRLNLGIYDNDRFIGWCWGRQDAPDRFCMVSSGLLPPYRGGGVYSALLPFVLETLKEKGFQVVFSRHTATNNAVLVPKLRAGFIITGMELSDIFGTMVHLSYYFNPLRRRAFDVRCGQSKADSELIPLLDFQAGDEG